MPACGTDKNAPPDGAQEPAATDPAADAEQKIEEEDMKIVITVKDKTFSVTPADSAAARELADMLPMTLEMSELNGNEKYCYLDVVLPTQASRPSGIRAGDLMLYGDSCIVLFYDSFKTSYSYTPLGHIDDTQGLAEALGSGSVTVTFEK